MQYNKILHDEQEIKKFYDLVLPRLKPLEVYFISLSARNKYLDAKQREFYNLGRTEMFAKTIIRKDTYEDFIKHVRRFECNSMGYTTRNNLALPSKAMVCYANIQPSSTVIAISKFQALLAEYNKEILQIISENKDYYNFVNRMNKVDNNLLSFYQNSHSSKKWIDIDIDIVEKKKDDIEKIKRSLEEYEFKLENTFLIETKSGYHVLLKKDSINRNPNLFTDSIKKHLVVKEVARNKNEMIPLPGTFQSTFAVKFRDF